MDGKSGRLAEYKVFFVPLLLVFIMFCTGCGKDSEEKKQEMKMDGLVYDASAEYSDKTILCWVVPFGIGEKEAGVFAEFNRILDEKGMDFAVSFCSVDKYDEEYTDFLIEAGKDKLNFDLFFTGYDYFGGLFRELVSQGLCADITEALTGESFRELYETLDTETWEALSFEGGIYGIKNVNRPAVANVYYVYFNSGLSEELPDNYRELTPDEEEFWTFAKKLTNREGLIPVAVKGGVLRWFEPAGTESIFNLLVCHGEVVNTLQEEQAFICSFGNVCDFEKNEFLQTVEMIEDPSRYGIVITDTPIFDSGMLKGAESGTLVNYAGAVTCISSWSEKKEYALELLQEIYTDPELSNLLAYGIAGENYELSGTEISYTDNKLSDWSSVYFCNRDIIYGNSDSLEKFDCSVYERSPLFGKCFSLWDLYREYNEEITDITNTELYFAGALESESGEEALSKIEKKFKEDRYRELEVLLKERLKALQGGGE